MTQLAARRGSRPRSPALTPDFYDRETEIVARELLGAVLECTTSEGIARGRIVETEAYLGEHDLACHAAAGRTSRTDPLYGAPGTAYVYFVYGMHWCFNAVTRAIGLPSAVLIRAIEPIDGLDLMRRRRKRSSGRDSDLTNGPAKLCQALAIDAQHNRVLLQRPPIVIRAGNAVSDDKVGVSARIGITRSADWPLRWFIRGNAFVSASGAAGKRATQR
jgi:DNA-3-methyladenine glycosylase